MGAMQSWSRTISGTKLCDASNGVTIAWEHSGEQHSTTFPIVELK